MKRTLFVFFGLLAIIAYVYISQTPAPSPKRQTAESIISPTIQVPKKMQSTVEDDGYSIAYVMHVARPHHVSLYSNLPAATASASLKEARVCTALVNAGFYSKEMTHLGRFRGTDGDYSRAIESTLLDGFLSIDDENRAHIGFDEPDIDAQIILQSGPIIRRNGSVRSLRLIEDKFARRIISGISNQGQLVFMALYFPDQEYSGPLLARVPYILEKIAKKEQIAIPDAINLDGGSASAFISSGTNLTELNTVGGFFCIKS